MKRSCFRLRQPLGRRRGFTLLEVVLSLSLSILLLSAIFTAMDQSWRLTASGREEMERSQLARALLSQIASDVRAIAFVPPAAESDETDSSTSATAAAASLSSLSGSSSSSSSSTTSSATPPVTLTSIGLRGNSQQVELHISRPRRDLDFTPGLDGSKLMSRSSDLLAVQYHMALPGSGLTGLVRTEGDRLTILTLESKGGMAETASRQQILAPEVASIQFRYFDGQAWYPTWESGGPVDTSSETTGTSSTTSSSGGSGGSGSSSSSTSSTGTQMTTSSTAAGIGRLPRAIEVVITLMPPRIQSGPLLRVGISSSTNQFRTVIVIPIADPLPEAFVP